MRKYFFYIAITFVILQFTFSVFSFSTSNILSVVNVAHAATSDEQHTADLKATLKALQQNYKDISSLPDSNTNKTSMLTKTQNQIESINAELNGNTETGFWGTMTNLANKLTDWPQLLAGLGIALLSAILVPIFSLILVITAYIMEVLLNFSINTEAFQNGQPIGQAIIFGWTFIRDLLNITLIFMLVWSGLKTILGLNKDLDNGLIGKVIFAGILVNFSLLFTQIIIDFFNIFAVAIMNSIKSAMVNAGYSSTINLGSFFFNTFFDKFWNNWTKMDLDQLKGTPALCNLAVELAIITTAIYVYFRVAKIFMVRSLVFIFCLITSPIMFFGFIAPKLENYRKQWQSNLINSSLTAPVFLACVFLVVKIMTSDGFKAVMDKGVVEEVGRATIGGVSIPSNIYIFKPEALVYFALIFALLYAAVRVTEEYSSSLGNTIWSEGINITKKVAGKVAGLAITAAMTAATGGAALAARSAAATLSNKALLNTAASTGTSAAEVKARNDARLQLSNAKRVYENPTESLKNTFAATKTISGFLGIKTSNKLEGYVKGGKWDPERLPVDNDPGIIRSVLGMSYKSSAQENKDNDEMVKKITEIANKQQTKEGEKYVKDNIEEEKNAADHSKNTIETINNEVANIAQIKADKLKNDKELKDLSEAISKENEEIIRIRKDIENEKKIEDGMRKAGKNPDATWNEKMLSLEHQLERAQERNTTRKIEANNKISAAGFNTNNIKISDDGTYNIKIDSKDLSRSLEEKTLSSLRNEQSGVMFGKSYKDMSDAAEDFAKKLEAKKAKVFKDSFDEFQRKGMVVTAESIRKKLKEEKSDKDKLWDMVSEEFEKKKKGGEEKPKEEKKPEPGEEKPKEEKK